VAKPIPKAHEVLVKVHYATVTRGDVTMRKISRLVLAVVGTLFGFKPMKIPGVEYAGVVEETGGEVTLFNKGDAVIGTTTGLSYGANAECTCVPEKPKNGVITHKAKDLSFKQGAAATVGSMTALQLLKAAKIKEGDRVLVYGASGSVGSYALQLAKHFGAEVTGVCSTGNLELIRSIGADRLIDYTAEDFTRSGQEYDIIFDAVGKLSKSKCSHSLADAGRYTSVRRPTREKVDELEYVQELVASGKVKVLIDREYPLEQIVEVHRYVESGRKRGNVVIHVAD
jgi:NADPH:quinone reductase-like Zn-dependent oxidoreductase